MAEVFAVEGAEASRTNKGERYSGKTIMSRLWSLAWLAAVILCLPTDAAPGKISVTTPANPTDTQLLDTVEHKAFAFFWNETDPKTGLTKDRARNFARQKDAYTVASIASVGYALASLPIAAERGWVKKSDAYGRALVTLRFVHDQLPNVHGFYYHFVDMKTGARVWKCELSSIDTALLALGALEAGQYWPKTEVQKLAAEIYERMDFEWMKNGGATLTMGWKPDSGFLDARWKGYSEASYLYFLALGSPTHALPASAWEAWDVQTAALEGLPVLGGPNPIFMAQMTPGYFHLKGMRDSAGRDWWTLWINAHKADRAYCKRNPEARKTYADGFWGITASDRPGGYGANEPQNGKNDGTVAPTAMLSAFCLAPELAKPALNLLWTQRQNLWGEYGFSNAFNLDRNWFDPDVIGIDLGMMLLSIENHRTGLPWRLMQSHPAVRHGLKTAGFHAAPEGENAFTPPARTHRFLPLRLASYSASSAR